MGAGGGGWGGVVGKIIPRIRLTSAKDLAKVETELGEKSKYTASTPLPLSSPSKRGYHSCGLNYENTQGLVWSFMALIAHFLCLSPFTLAIFSNKNRISTKKRKIVNKIQIFCDVFCYLQKQFDISYMETMTHFWNMAIAHSIILKRTSILSCLKCCQFESV